MARPERVPVALQTNPGDRRDAIDRAHRLAAPAGEVDRLDDAAARVGAIRGGPDGSGE
jgi:hypothetical protein